MPAVDSEVREPHPSARTNMTAGTHLFAALAVALCGGEALAFDPPVPPSAEQRLVCRGGERRLGTRTRTERRCRTAEQWRQEDEEGGRLPVSLQVTQGQNDGRQTAAPR